MPFISELCFPLFCSSWGILNGITNEDPEAHRSVAQCFVFDFGFFCTFEAFKQVFHRGLAKVVNFVNICRVWSNGRRHKTMAAFTNIIFEL